MDVVTSRPLSELVGGAEECNTRFKKIKKHYARRKKQKSVAHV
jgi:hypothetical protein